MPACFALVVTLFACGGRNETAEDTAGGDTVVTDEAWEASAWEPEPEPAVEEPAEPVEAWTIETWRSTLDDRASDCDAIPTWTPLQERANAYATSLEAGESPEALLAAHEEVIALLGEWERECAATAPSREVEITESTNELRDQLELITTSTFEE